jgi:hypothetical protein
MSNNPSLHNLIQFQNQLLIFIEDFPQQFVDLIEKYLPETFSIIKSIKKLKIHKHILFGGLIIFSDLKILTGYFQHLYKFLTKK